MKLEDAVASFNGGLQARDNDSLSQDILVRRDDGLHLKLVLRIFLEIMNK